MSAQSRTMGACLVLVSLLAFPAVAEDVMKEEMASDPHAHHREMMKTKAEQKAQAAILEIRDAQLVNQDGETKSLSSDIVGDRIVVVDFIYTTCTTVCPVLSAVLMQVQDELGDRLGTEVMLVSISVDPQRDTPARLKDYAGKLHARDGWTWLTGDKLEVDEVLKDFGAYTPNFEDHPAMVLVGDGTTGKWSRFLGFPGANHIVDKINEFAAARSAQSAVRE
jgi:protein SCO1/2